MRKIMKMALEQEQIRVKSQYDRFDGYEIHLYGDDRDHFELAETIAKPIITVHYPIARCDVSDVASEYDSPYAKKVYELCDKTGADLVVHAERGLDHLVTCPRLREFCDFIRERGTIVHVENCYRYCGAIEAMKVTRYLQALIGFDRVYPLLDTCHLMMSEMSFKFEEHSFFTTIDDYTSDRFIIHLNDCIGSGEQETGGIHGTNFYANQYLLSNILWKLYGIVRSGKQVDLVLEVNEVDYDYPTNADILAKNIDRLWAGILKEKQEQGL